MPKHKIEFKIPADLKFSSLIRRISEEIFHHVGFSREWANRLQLVVDELFMNANYYGSKTADDKIFLLFEFDEDELNFRIEDEGKGDSKMRAEDLKKVIQKNTDEMSDTSKTSGRGLALISSLWTDSMTVENGQYGGIAICFSKKILDDTPPTIPPVELTAYSPNVEALLQGTKDEMSVSGEIGTSNAEEKIKLINDKVNTLSPGSTLVLDCKDLVYINSIFIGHLAAWLNHLQSRQGHLILKNTNKQIRGVLELVGLNKVIYLES